MKSNITQDVEAAAAGADVFPRLLAQACALAGLREPALRWLQRAVARGFINYPFLGGVRATGLTVAELENRIRTGLRSGYLVNPDVRVALAQFRPVYISGQVRQSGAYPYSQGLTVDKAITLAGGMTAFASSNRIFIQRQGTGQLERTRAQLDTPVFPGDTIVVEERLF